MKIDERHLIQLAAVVQAGGVTEGAAMIGLTQPAVSRTLSMLEKRLGEPLFLKGRRPLQPTPLGRSLKFGLLTGALSVLRSRDKIDDDAGLVTLAANGGDGERFERLWNRLAWPPEREGDLLPRQS